MSLAIALSVLLLLLLLAVDGSSFTRHQPINTLLDIQKRAMNRHRHHRPQQHIQQERSEHALEQITALNKSDQYKTYIIYIYLYIYVVVVVAPGGRLSGR